MKCTRNGIMEKKAFTLPEMLAVGVPTGTAIGTANYMAYKHNPEGYKRGGVRGALGGAAFASGAGFRQILKGSGSAKQKALKALILAAIGGTIGGETGALGRSILEKRGEIPTPRLIPYIQRILRAERAVTVPGVASGDYLGRINASLARAHLLREIGRPFPEKVMKNVQHLKRVAQRTQDLVCAGYNPSRAGTRLTDIIHTSSLPKITNRQQNLQEAALNLLKEIGFVK